VLYRKLTHDYPLIVRGEGCVLYDDQGRSYLDGCGGAYVATLGHGVTEIADAIGAQARAIAYVNGTVFTHEPAEALAADLARLAPGDLDKVYFLSSGSEAVEAALKLARQYWVESGRPGKHKIIALSPGYHGNTLLALSASAREHYKTFFREWLVDVVQMPAPYGYRCPCRGERADCPRCNGALLEETILREGADTVAAFIMEPVGGSSTGGNVPRPEYLARVREICDRHEVLLIADEVLCGAGRTGTWSAIEATGVVPDLMTMGKGITGGYVPLSAVLAPARITDVLAHGSGALLHAQTFSHHPVLCAAGLATVRYLEQHDLVARCACMGRLLHEALEPLREMPHVGDLRGRGLLAGIEFVAEKDSRDPFPRARKFAERFADQALAEGLVVWPNVGQADGTRGDLALLAPPFVVTEEEIHEMVARFRRALVATISVTG